MCVHREKEGGMSERDLLHANHCQTVGLLIRIGVDTLRSKDTGYIVHKWVVELVHELCESILHCAHEGGAYDTVFLGRHGVGLRVGVGFGREQHGGTS